MLVALYTTYGSSNDPSTHPAYTIEVADLVEFITRSWCFKRRFAMTFSFLDYRKDWFHHNL